MKLHTIIIAFFVLSSCQEITARKLAGHYDGTLRTYDQQPGETPVESTKPIEFVVTKHKHSVDVLNEVIPEDSLADGYYERANENGNGGINSVRVKDDSMIVILFEKDKFGYIRFNEYRGIK